MVHFARPDFLGSKKEFRNRFENPILSGQCRGSSARDLELARRRSFVLTSELRPLVLRRDVSYLKAQLPPKREWVLCCRQSNTQVRPAL